MSGDSYELGRRRLLQAAGASVAGVGTLWAGTGVTGARQVDEAPDADEYEDILSAMEGDGTEDDPYVVTDVVELQAMAGDLSAWYELGTDIDASATANWNEGAGFNPIFDDEAADPTEEEVEEAEPEGPAEFSGVLNGNGHEISGLTIDRPDGPGAGLLLVNQGAVADLRLTDATVTGTIAGIVAASNGGDPIDPTTTGGIAAVTVEGTVTGDDDVGGVVGVNAGLINESEANVDVSGEDRVGGIAGANPDTIAGSTARGTVEGARFTGGAVGQAAGTLQTSEADVDVTGTVNVGGFAGEVTGTVNGCSASGSVAGRSEVGGFAGESWADLLGSTASGPVEGEEEVGGLVGTNYGEIRVCAAHGDVSGDEGVGGLVGWGTSGTVVSDVYSVGAVDGEEAAGSLVGLLGWEFFNDGETAELERAYWSVDDTDRDPVGRIDTGDGEVTVDEETLVALERDQFFGETVPEHMTMFDFDVQWRPLTDEMPIPRAQAASIFQIRDISTREITVREDETFTVEVQVENTGEWEGTQTIGFLIDEQLFETVEQRLDAGESTQVTFEDLQAAEIPVGNYEFSVRTRNDNVGGTLEVESAPEDTPENGDDEATPEPNGTPDADDDGPGFGVGAAIAGIGSGAYLLSRRMSGESSAEE